MFSKSDPNVWAGGIMICFHEYQSWYVSQQPLKTSKEWRKSYQKEIVEAISEKKQEDKNSLDK